MDFLFICAFGRMNVHLPCHLVLPPSPDLSPLVITTFPLSSRPFFCHLDLSSVISTFPLSSRPQGRDLSGDKKRDFSLTLEMTRVRSHLDLFPYHTTHPPRHSTFLPCHLDRRESSPTKKTSFLAGVCPCGDNIEN